MERIISQPYIPSDGRKPNLWDRIKQGNSSSPSLHKVDIKNWSTRSLPRLGSFGSSPVSCSSSVISPKSTPSSSPVIGTLNISEESLQQKRQVINDYFSTLPNEVKLLIFSYLPITAIARVSMVQLFLCISDCRCVNS